MRVNELIVEKIKERLAIGAKRYGEEINIKKEKRVFIAESLEEALDMAVYLSIALIKLELKHERNLTENELQSSIIGAVTAYMDSYPGSRIQSDVLSTGIILKMKEKMRKKYGL